MRKQYFRHTLFIYPVFCMKKRIFATLALAVALPLMAFAQAQFGYLSYSQALQAMPDYAIAQRQIDTLQQQYAQEMKRVEDEFNQKYEEFIEQQSDLATPIRMKRQAELQELMEKNIAFRDEAKRLLDEAKVQLMQPLYQKLDTALQTLGQERGYAFILNIDGNALPYINPEMGEDVSAAVVEAFNIED